LTDQNHLNWLLVIVQSRSEKRAASLLRSKGFDVFLPLQHARRQWSDRIKIVEIPLFACNLFCRCGQNDYLTVLNTPGVFSFFEYSGKPIVIPDAEIDRLIRITATAYFIQACENPGSGDIVSLAVDQSLEGVMVEQGSECEVVFHLASLGRAVSLKVPFESLLTRGQRTKAATYSGNQ
jgi:transcription antitermination factor NusG